MPPPPPPPPREEERTDDETEDELDQWVESESEDESSEDDDEEDDGEEDEEECREKGRGGAGVSAAAAALFEEHGSEAMTPAGPTCCVCMEPWTCADAHRICCIPCGHVYGRSCLEKWLRRCGNTSAKCPQCGQPYGHKHITNLYPSGNVWDGCCRLLQIQELKARLAVTVKNVERLMVDVPQSIAQLRSDVAEAHAKLRAELESQLESIQQLSWEESAQDAAAVVQAEFLSMKGQLRKMAGEQKATPVDLLRFMEQNGAKLWEAIRSSRPPAPAAATHACTGTLED